MRVCVCVENSSLPFKNFQEFWNGRVRFIFIIDLEIIVYIRLHFSSISLNFFLFCSVNPVSEGCQLFLVHQLCHLIICEYLFTLWCWVSFGLSLFGSAWTISMCYLISNRCAPWSSSFAHTHTHTFASLCLGFDF